MGDHVQRHVIKCKFVSCRRHNILHCLFPCERVSRKARQKVRVDFDGTMSIVSKQCRFLMVVVIDGIRGHLVGPHHAVPEVDDRVVGGDGVGLVHDQEIYVGHSACRGIGPDVAFEQRRTFECNSGKPLIAQHLLKFVPLGFQIGDPYCIPMVNEAQCQLWTGSDGSRCCQHRCKTRRQDRGEPSVDGCSSE